MCQEFPAAVARVYESGVVKAVMAAMRANSATCSNNPDGFVQERGCEFLAVLISTGTGGQSGCSPQAPSTIEIVACVLEAMGDLHSSAAVQVAACRALNDMAKVSPTWSLEIVVSGGIEII